jgi:hypothetical protein
VETQAGALLAHVPFPRRSTMVMGHGVPPALCFLIGSGLDAGITLEEYAGRRLTMSTISPSPSNWVALTYRMRPLWGFRGGGGRRRASRVETSENGLQAPLCLAQSCLFLTDHHAVRAITQREINNP